MNRRFDLTPIVSKTMKAITLDGSATTNVATKRHREHIKKIKNHEETFIRPSHYVSDKCASRGEDRNESYCARVAP